MLMNFNEFRFLWFSVSVSHKNIDFPGNEYLTLVYELNYI